MAHKKLFFYAIVHEMMMEKLGEKKKLETEKKNKFPTRASLKSSNTQKKLKSIFKKKTQMKYEQENRNERIVYGYVLGKKIKILKRARTRNV